MRQVVLEEPGRFSLRAVPDPVPRKGDALVRVRRIGVCGTDLHAFAGRQPFFTYPRVLGHELAVTVEQLPLPNQELANDPLQDARLQQEQFSREPLPRERSREWTDWSTGEARSARDAGAAARAPDGGAGGAGGDVPTLRIGDVCAVRPFLDNPESRATKRGRPNCCEDLRVLGVHVDGGMGDLLAIPPRFLHPVADADLDVLALVEPLSIGCHAVTRAAVTRADDVLVIGAGPIGLAVLQFAMLDAGRVTVVDLAPARLALAESLFASPGGLTADPAHHSRPAGVASASGFASPGPTQAPGGLRIATAVPSGARFDVVFDATGSAASMNRAFDFVAAGGRLVFVGLTLEPIGLSDPEFHRREITLLASRNATPEDFTRVLATIQSGLARPAAWITHRLALDDVPAKFGEVRSDPTLVKAIVDVT